MSIERGPWTNRQYESFKNSPGGGMKWTPCHLEVKVSLLNSCIVFWSLKTMPIRALLSTSYEILSFGNYSIPKIILWQSTWRAVVRHCVSLLSDVLFYRVDFCLLAIYIIERCYGCILYWKYSHFRGQSLIATLYWRADLVVQETCSFV